MNILFVCTGNICRSPLAEVMARKMYAGDEITFTSAGTYAIDGNPATGTGRAAAATLGLELGAHRARSLTRGMIQDAEIIFVMEGAQRDQVRKLDSDADVRLLQLDESEIPDPYGKDLESYLAVYETIRHALEARLAEFR